LGSFTLFFTYLTIYKADRYPQVSLFRVRRPSTAVSQHHVNGSALSSYYIYFSKSIGRLFKFPIYWQRSTPFLQSLFQLWIKTSPEVSIFLITISVNQDAPRGGCNLASRF